MILPKIGDHYLKYIVLCFHMEHQVRPCNMFTQNALCFLPRFMEILPLWQLHEFWVHLDCYGKNMNKKNGAKKLAMSTKQMQDIFSPMFFYVLRENILSVFEEKNMSSFVHKHFMRTYFLFSQQNCVQLWWYVIQWLVKTSDVPTAIFMMVGPAGGHTASAAVVVVVRWWCDMVPCWVWQSFKLRWFLTMHVILIIAHSRGYVKSWKYLYILAR